MRERGMFFNKSTKLGNSEVRARRLGQNFCKRSGPQGLQSQRKGLEIRMSERSEFTYFPCSRLRRS